MRNYLLTGGSGFIGTHLVEHLLKDDSTGKVIIFDKIAPPINIKGVEFYSIDICKAIDWGQRVENYTLVHLAALCKEPGYTWEEYFETNYIGTKNVIDFAERSGIRRIVFTSTMMVFRAGEKRYFENDLKAPDTAYGMSKLLAEEAMLAWASRSTDRKLTIVRPGVVFGKGENGNYLRLYRALRNNIFCYVGRRTTIKSSVYVKDLVSFISQSLKSDFPNQVYNFVLPQPITIEEIVHTFCKLFGWRRFIPTIPYWLLMVVSYLCEVLDHIGLRNDIHHRRVQKLYYSSNLSSELVIKDGFHFTYDLEAALKDWKNECGGIELC